MSDRHGGGDEILHATVRGVVGALAMSGMRTLTVDLGLVGQTPPEAIVGQKARGLLRHVPPPRRRAVIEAVHCTYGAGGGAAFGALPEQVRRRAWAGPAYGLLLWAGYETVLAPALGLWQAGRQPARELAALAGDHLLYGFVLSEMRARPQG